MCLLRSTTADLVNGGAKSTLFRQICLFILDSTQEIYISSNSKETSLQMYTTIFSLEIRMVEILTDLNWY